MQTGLIPATFILTVLSTALLLLPIGAWIVFRALRGRRRGIEPHCRRCKYLLINLASDRCPECGTLLSRKMIVLGTGRRRPILLIFGLGLCGFALLIGLPMIRFLPQIDWYHFKSDAGVIHDLQSKEALQRQALAELALRMKNNSLSIAAQKQLMQAAIGFMKSDHDRKSRAVYLNLAEYLVNSPDIDNQLKQQFFERCASVEIKVRPLVHEAEQIPYQMTVRNVGPQDWSVQVSEVSIAVDQESPQVIKAESNADLNGRNETRNDISGLLPGNSMGLHALTAQWSVQISSGGAIFTRHFNISRTFEVVGGNTSIVTENPDPAIRKKLEKAITVEAMTFFGKDSKYGIRGHLMLDQLPYGVAFKVYARVEGKETYITSVFAPAHVGRIDCHLVGAISTGTDYESPPPMDIILRSDTATAAQSLTLTEIWGGELIIPHVKLRNSIEAPWMKDLKNMPD